MDVGLSAVSCAILGGVGSNVEERVKSGWDAKFGEGVTKSSGLKPSSVTRLRRQRRRKNAMRAQMITIAPTAPITPPAIAPALEESEEPELLPLSGVTVAGA